ncbi:MAG: tetratricopeptide repeat protein [Planctomycetota bacterium]
MKPLVLLPVAVLLSVAASFVVVRMSAKPIAAAPPAASDELGRLADVVARIDSRQESLSKSLEDLRAQVASDSRGDARVPVGEIEAAVARAMASPPAVAPVEKAPVAAAAPRTAQSFLDQLLNEDLSEDQTEAIWKAASEAGQFDALVALFEERAKADPENADAQLDLGMAYLQKVFKAGGGPEAGTWAIKADKSFDAALAVNDQHWDARFAKAISLSFWPPVFGKQTEAIKHFEILIDQQRNLPSDPNHAQTWLLLGNMYQQLGKADQALATWQKGLALFPDNTQLSQQISNGQGN